MGKNQQTGILQLLPRHLAQQFGTSDDEAVKKALMHPGISYLGGRTIDMPEFVKDIPIKTLAEITNEIFAGNQHQREQNRFQWKEGIASPTDLRQDFDLGSSKRSSDFLWGGSYERRRDMLIRAIPGHATSGHGLFREYRDENGVLLRSFPNTMSEDVAAALIPFPKKYHLGSVEEFAAGSQAEIDEIVNFFERFFDDPYNSAEMPMENLDGQVLSSLKIFRKRKHLIDMLEANRGFQLGSGMDNYDTIRTAVKEKYGWEMGGGRTYAADINRLKDLNISLDELAKGYVHIPFIWALEKTQQVELLKELGIVVGEDIELDSLDTKTLSWDKIKEQGINKADHPEKDIRKIYIREQSGRGVADDVAVFLASFMPHTFRQEGYQDSPYAHLSKLMGAFFADRIDTLEKDAEVIIPGGQDEIAGEYLARRFAEACKSKKFRNAFKIKDSKDMPNGYEIMPQDMIVDYTAASAIVRTCIHSSQRYFLMRQSYEDGAVFKDTCAIKEYLRQASLYARANGIDHHEVVANLNKIPDISIGFDNVPFSYVTEVLGERLDLVSGNRTKRLGKFFEEMLLREKIGCRTRKYPGDIPPSVGKYDLGKYLRRQ